MTSRADHFDPMGVDESKREQLDLLRERAPATVATGDSSRDPADRRGGVARSAAQAFVTRKSARREVTITEREAQERGDLLRTTQEAARYLGLRPATLHKWRILGSHLPFVKFGSDKGRIRYRQRDLDLFIERSLHRSTSEPA